MNPPASTRTPRRQRVRLDEKFVNRFARKQPDWGPLGWITYKRTYSRWADRQMTRREEWHETVQRVVEGNINLDPRPRTPEVVAELEHEAKRMFELIYNFAWTPPGRGLWMSGTDYAREQGSAQVNCWVVAVRPGAYEEGAPIKVSLPFVMAMDLLMLGGGVGFSVTRENILQIPPVKNPVALSIVCDAHHPNIGELDAGLIPQATHTMIRVEDTRRGWTDALRVIIDSHFKGGNRERHIAFDVSDIRARGEAIKGFGGTAAGPGPLVSLLRSVNNVLNDRVGTNLASVDCLDIANQIGRCVVAGNVRRSAELVLGSSDDLAFIAAKQNQEALMSHRWASNNSIAIDGEFTDFERIAAGITANGEPGIINLELCRTRGRLADEQGDERNALVEGTNPCGEVPLQHGEPCNLAEVFPARCEEQGVDIEEVLRLALRYTKRVTCANYHWPDSDRVITENRRVGVSLSGVRDWMLLRGVDDLEQLSADLDRFYSVIRDEDRIYSELLGVNESVAVTCVKPSGSVSLLPNVSPGMHAHYAPYYIRRIRFQEADPLVELIEGCGFHVEPDAYSPNTVVAEFPIKAPGADNPRFKGAGELTIEEQLATQASLQRWWADNAVSATITFRPKERRKIAGLLRDYRDQLKSTSLLPYTDPGETSSYTQMPYEPITKERYEELIAGIKQWPQQRAAKLHEERRREFDLVDQDECEGGACPVR